MVTTAAVEAGRKIRDPGFARRLDQACVSSPRAPSGYGRLSWIAKEINGVMGTSISAQTVSRWFSGEAKPRKETNDALAELLGVDSIWLYLGAGSNKQGIERSARNALAAGSINVVAGLIQMDGGNVAFPEAGDPNAQKDGIHLDAIIKGRRYSFHVATPDDKGDSYQFIIPHAGEHVTFLGLVRDGFNFHVYEISSETIGEYGVFTREGVVITLEKDTLPNYQIRSFAQRL